MHLVQPKLICVISPLEICLLEAVREVPDRLRLSLVCQTDDRRQWTYRELLLEAEAVARAYRSI